MQRIQLLVLGISAATLTFFTATARADHGTFLPDAPFQLGNPATVNVTAWSTADADVTAFNQNVSQGGKNVGTINFNYDTLTGTTVARRANVFGAGLSGGFTTRPNAGIGIVDGFALSWAQVVLPATTLAGRNSWNSPNGSAFPDTANTTSPAYPALTVSRGPAPTIGFRDYPIRGTTAGTWRAELALVGIDEDTHTIRIVDTFGWGFVVTAAPASVTPFAPRAWGPATATFDTTLRNAFSGPDGAGINGVHGTAWTVEDNLNTFPVFTFPAPEPTCFGLLLVVGAGGLARRPNRGMAHETKSAQCF